MPFLESIEYATSSVIGIDEAQFFPDLYEFVVASEKENKKIIIAGLDGDFNRKPFGREFYKRITIIVMILYYHILYRMPLKKNTKSRKHLKQVSCALEYGQEVKQAGKDNHEGRGLE